MSTETGTSSSRPSRLASTSDTGIKANTHSENPSLSSAGNRVAFTTGAGNLDPADTDTASDVYVKNLATGDIQLVSTSDKGVKGDGGSYQPVISSDGKRVAFTSNAGNLDPADGDRDADVYVKDLTTGDIALASLTAEGVAGDGDSSRPVLSGEGRKVGFQSDATNLDPVDTDGTTDVYVGQPAVCTIVGTAGTDTLIGTAGRDVICARGGNDTLLGGAGDDVLLGEDGGDLLEGGPGADAMDGGALGGADLLFYLASDDGVDVSLTRGTGVGGEAEGDTFVGVEDVLGSEFPDVLVGDASANVLYGEGGADSITGAAGNDVLYGNPGDDFLDGGPGADHVDGSLPGSADFDTVYYDESPAAVQVDLGADTGRGGDAEGDTFVEIDRVVGSPYADGLTGDDGDNYLEGGLGDDVLAGGLGGDTLVGGPGADLASYKAATIAVEVDLLAGTATGGARGDFLNTIEGVVGTALADRLTGDFFDNVLAGMGGADDLDGSGGFDFVSYEASPSAVTVNLAAQIASGGYADGDDLGGFEGVVGSAFADVLSGTNNTDHLLGEGGDDTLVGLNGDDLLLGTTGTDTFNAGGGTDTCDDVAGEVSISCDQ